MEKVYIFGHQKPDTDSITSAISLSYLKNKLGMHTVPARLGEINDETKYVLKYFNVATPMFIEDVKLQLKDLNYHKDYFINQNVSIKQAYDYMTEKGITGIPVVDDNKKFVGLVTVKTIFKDLINGDFSYLHTSYNNILNTLEGEEVLKFDEEITGNLMAAAYRSATIINNVPLEKNHILIVGDRYSVIEYAIMSKVKLLIVVGNGEINEEHLNLARENHVNIIRTKFDTFHTTKVIGLANYLKNVIPSDRPYTFDEGTYYDDFVVKTSKLKHNNYPIIGKNDICKGLIRITEITDKRRKKVILVDHNELEQSAEGLEEADIIEIVDHHKIGNISTKNPINFRNMSVGCTNTIIYLMYQENNVEIPREIAGVMLSGILSDTLALTSPTTTDLDRQVVFSLAKIVDIDYQKYALDMFKAGTSLQGKTIEEIVNTDIKGFANDDLTFAVSQVFTLDIDSILARKEEYIDYINELAKNKEYRLVLLVVTDIIRNGSYLFYTDGSSEIISDGFDIIDMKQGTYVDGVVSRKKQVVPAIMDVIR
ncbi:putative manganese-dependent inorganic diphosphatase [bacterium]|nr:putative manganese-dependent inorganic diphosphatase [bacterium]